MTIKVYASDIDRLRNECKEALLKEKKELREIEDKIKTPFLFRRVVNYYLQ